MALREPPWKTSMKCNLQSILCSCCTHIFKFSYCSQCAHRPKFEFTLKTLKSNFDWSAFTVDKMMVSWGCTPLWAFICAFLLFITIQWAFYSHRISHVVLPCCYSSPEGANETLVNLAAMVDFSEFCNPQPYRHMCTGDNIWENETLWLTPDLCSRLAGKIYSFNQFLYLTYSYFLFSVFVQWQEVTTSCHCAFCVTDINLYLSNAAF